MELRLFYLSVAALFGGYQLAYSQVDSLAVPAVKNDSLTTKKEVVKTGDIEDVVITGTMKAVSRLESPVPVEVYTPTFFRKNPTPSIFDALQTVNGVRPQLNCNICNTGDIYINGLEGP